MDYQAKAEELALNAYGFWNRVGAWVAKNPKKGVVGMIAVGFILGALIV